MKWFTWKSRKRYDAHVIQYYIRRNLDYIEKREEELERKWRGKRMRERLLKKKLRYIR